MRWRSFDVTRVERPCAVPSLEGRLGWVPILSLSPSPSLPHTGRETLRRSIDVSFIERLRAVPSLEGRLGWVLILSLSPSPSLPHTGRETLRRSTVVSLSDRLRAVPSLEGRLGWVPILEFITLSISPSHRERDAPALNCRARARNSITAVYKFYSYSA